MAILASGAFLFIEQTTLVLVRSVNFYEARNPLSKAAKT
jgi:hypothetical protein